MSKITPCTDVRSKIICNRQSLNGTIFIFLPYKKEVKLCVCVCVCVCERERERERERETHKEATTASM